MAYGKPARTATRSTRSSVHGARRRALLGTVAVLLLAYTALSGAGRPPNRHDRMLNRGSRALYAEGRALTNDQTDLPAVSWPRSGQAAFVLGSERPSVSPSQPPAPIASLAKVMTAYLPVERYPIAGENGSRSPSQRPTRRPQPKTLTGTSR